MSISTAEDVKEMKNTEFQKISDYLIYKLQSVGIQHIFGIPGDYVINFYNKLEESPIEVIGTCSEQGAGFAADAYARVNGIGAVCITYSVGGLNTINAIAGAYAEKSPVIVISGAPGLQERDSDFLLHHSIRDFNSQLKIFNEVTVASAQLEDPNTAIYEIDRVINACIRYKRPVYLELPRDMVDTLSRIAPTHRFIPDNKNPQAFEEVVNEAVTMIKNAKKTAIIAGVEIRRYGLEQNFTEFLNKSGYPYATTILGKTLIDESHPQFLGVYIGKVGSELVSNYIEDADCILILGALLTDLNHSTANLDRNKIIYASSDEFYIKHHYYKNIQLKAFMDTISEKLANEDPRTIYNLEKATNKPAIKADEPLKAVKFFDMLEPYVEENNLLICDVGDSLLGTVDFKLPAKTNYFGPSYYTSMGNSIPAALGAQMKNRNRRPIIVVGDGAFQMTGQEVSCFVKYGLNPIIFVMNNKGYTTQRFLKDNKFNDLQNWHYDKITELVGGGVGFDVKTEGELQEAMIKAKENTESFSIINVHLDKYDTSKNLSRLTQYLKAKVQ